MKAVQAPSPFPIRLVVSVSWQIIHLEDQVQLQLMLVRWITHDHADDVFCVIVNDRLTTVNIILLALGVTLEVVILCSAIATTIVILVSKRKLKKGIKR